MNPENPNFEPFKNNNPETTDPTQENIDNTSTPETQKEASSNTFEVVFEYARKKEENALSETLPKYSNCYKLATSFAGFTIEVEKDQN